MEKPFFSIFIPTKNRSTLLIRALDSCWAQTYPDYEIVVVDDGSADETQEALKAVARPNLKVLRHAQSEGKVAAFVSALAACSGRYIAFLDDDDIWLPEHLESFKKAIEVWPSPNCIFYTPVQIARSDKIRIRPDSKIGGSRFLDYILRKRGLIQNSGICMNADFMRTLEFSPDVKKHVDYELCQLAEHAGGSFVMLPTATAVWDCTGRRPRLSTTGMEGSEAWFSRWQEKSPTIFTEANRVAFMAFHHAPLLASTSPTLAIKLLTAAVAKGYFSLSLTLRVFRRFFV